MPAVIISPGPSCRAIPPNVVGAVRGPAEREESRVELGWGEGLVDTAETLKQLAPRGNQILPHQAGHLPGPLLRYGFEAFPHGFRENGLTVPRLAGIGRPKSSAIT